MSLLGRSRRPDDWADEHARARFRAAERLAAPLDAEEERWLDDHLASCAACATTAADYSAERLALRALRDRQPQPPRDLWARTAAAIEREAGHRAIRPAHAPRRSWFAPYAVLAGALVVAVVYGLLSSSRLPIDPATTTPGITASSVRPSVRPSAGPTPLVIDPQDVAYVSLEDDGYRVVSTRVDRVCAPEADGCGTSRPTEIADIGPLSSPATVFGSGDRPLVIVADASRGSTVIAIDPSAATPVPTAEPTPSAEPTPTSSPGRSAAVPSSAVPSSEPTPSPSPSNVPPPSAPTEPTEPDTTSDPSEAPSGAVEIARGLEVVGTTAAYAPDGSAFAFTAVPADGSSGPDIYVWTVGDDEARPITADHRSVLGSWAGGAIVGSTVIVRDGANEPAAFVLAEPDGERVLRPETGLVWRPVVDPTGGSAVYWSGSVEPTEDGTGWAPAGGSLVIGRWGTDGDAADGTEPTPPADDQAEARSETTIATGPIDDWDVRWDETGERLAVWIADADDPSVGRLSLYVVDPFDGEIDLANPPLADEPALAGFSLADGRLAWATPGGESGKSSRVRILAWTDEGFGQVETAPGDFLVVR